MSGENIFLTVITIGVLSLLQTSMILQNGSQPGEKHFPQRKLFQIIISSIMFFSLAILGFFVCSKGYCTEHHIIQGFSRLGVLGLSIICIKLITPFFIGHFPIKYENEYQSFINDNTKQTTKTSYMQQYISYIILLGCIIFLIVFVEPGTIGDMIREFFLKYGINNTTLSQNYFDLFIKRSFYVITFSAFIGILFTINVFTKKIESKETEKQKLYNLRKNKEIL